MFSRIKGAIRSEPTVKVEQKANGDGSQKAGRKPLNMVKLVAKLPSKPSVKKPVVKSKGSGKKNRDASPAQPKVSHARPSRQNHALQSPGSIINVPSATDEVSAYVDPSIQLTEGQLNSVQRMVDDMKMLQESDIEIRAEVGRFLKGFSAIR